ncbi:MAG: methyltransferase domain-containing protein [Capsulimonadaceae bacterium]|nr:methyltransferase domain-containing protein [Capsulimonadaceae bacterium]
MNIEEYERMYRFEDHYWWFVARRDLIAQFLKDLALPAGIDILDIGCGTGAMLDKLEEFGNVVGADFSTEALAFCRKRGQREGKQYRLVRADIRCLPFADNSFDVITAMDIVEHIDHDALAVSEIRRVLKPGGYLLATVPAYMSLWSNHDIALHHHRRYTARGFRDVAQRAGLRVAKLTYTVTSLLPLVWIFRRLERFTKSKTSEPQADVVPLPGLVNKVLLALMEAETQFVRRRTLPFGVTVAAIARKDPA